MFNNGKLILSNGYANGGSSRKLKESKWLLIVHVITGLYCSMSTKSYGWHKNNTYLKIIIFIETRKKNIKNRE